MNTAPTWPELMDADTAAAYWSLSKRSFQRMVSAGTVKGRKLGPRIIRFSKTEMDEAAAQFPVGKGEAPGQ